MGTGSQGPLSGSAPARASSRVGCICRVRSASIGAAQALVGLGRGELARGAATTWALDDLSEEGTGRRKANWEKANHAVRRPRGEPAETARAEDFRRLKRVLPGAHLQLQVIPWQPTHHSRRSWGVQSKLRNAGAGLRWGPQLLLRV